MIVRFIPARAGNSDSFLNFFLFFTVHPRAGGELGNGAIQPLFPDGSSPRGRGTLDLHESAIFLPTVHPRAGGELFVSI